MSPDRPKKAEENGMSDLRKQVAANFAKVAAEEKGMGFLGKAGLAAAGVTAAALGGPKAYRALRTSAIRKATRRAANVERKAIKADRSAAARVRSQAARKERLKKYPRETRGEGKGQRHLDERLDAARESLKRRFGK